MPGGERDAPRRDFDLIRLPDFQVRWNRLQPNIKAAGVKTALLQDTQKVGIPE